MAISDLRPHNELAAMNHEFLRASLLRSRLGLDLWIILQRGCQL